VAGRGGEERQRRQRQRLARTPDKVMVRARRETPSPSRAVREKPTRVKDIWSRARAVTAAILGPSAFNKLVSRYVGRRRRRFFGVGGARGCDRATRSSRSTSSRRFFTNLSRRQGGHDRSLLLFSSLSCDVPTSPRVSGARASSYIESLLSPRCSPNHCRFGGRSGDRIGVASRWGRRPQGRPAEGGFH
jgi:hypothetical protein